MHNGTSGDVVLCHHMKRQLYGQADQQCDECWFDIFHQSVLILVSEKRPSPTHLAQRSTAGLVVYLGDFSFFHHANVATI